MSVTPEIDLTEAQRGALHDVFRRHIDRLETVSVYGSRAQGTARPGSDVDIVLYGRVTPSDIATMASDLEDSALSIFADIVAYDLITHEGLKRQIDRFAKPLFRHEDLLAA